MYKQVIASRINDQENENIKVYHIKDVQTETKEIIFGKQKIL